MVNIERSKLNHSMYQKLKKYIMNKRKREFEERKQDAYLKKLKREKEERKKQAELDSVTLERTKNEMSSITKKLEELRAQKSDLFQRFKQIANEESRQKEKQKSEAAALMAMSGTQFSGHPSAMSHQHSLYLATGHPVGHVATAVHPSAAIAAAMLQASAATTVATTSSGAATQDGQTRAVYGHALNQAQQQAHQKLLMVQGSGSASGAGNKRTRSPSPPPTSAGYHTTAFKTSASHPVYPPAKMPTYTQSSNGPSLYLDRSGQSASDVEAGKQAVYQLEAPGAAMSKYLNTSGYQHPSAAALYARHATSMVAHQQQATTRAGTLLEPLKSGGGSVPYPKNLLPPAPTSYRGSITTGQSAQQIQFQQYQQQMQIHQQIMAAAAAQQQAHQAQQQQQQHSPKGPAVTPFSAARLVGVQGYPQTSSAAYQAYPQPGTYQSQPQRRYY